MRLDGSLSEAAWLVFGAALLAAAAVSALRFGSVPKRQYLLDPRGGLYAGFWNFLSAKKWTAEGLDLHRRFLRFGMVVAAGLLGLWLVLDALT